MSLEARRNRISKHSTPSPTKKSKKSKSQDLVQSSVQKSARPMAIEHKPVLGRDGFRVPPDWRRSLPPHATEESTSAVFENDTTLSFQDTASGPSQSAKKTKPVSARSKGDSNLSVKPYKHASPSAKRALEPVSTNTRSSPRRVKIAQESRSAKRKVARTSKKKVYNEDDDEDPSIYFPYMKCGCDFISDGEGGYALDNAEKTGKVTWVLTTDGFDSTCPHLRECKRFPVKYPVKYDPTTIARDILRATGSHPYLPALNQNWNEKLAGELNAIVNR